jgi:hypothetical protein
MGPRPTTPVNPPCVPVSTCVPPIQKLSTPPRVSVGVSPIRPQHIPTRTFVSRGVSPVPMIDLLPPDLAAMLMETQVSQAYCPISLTKAISVTSSESENEHGKAPSRFRSRARSPEFVPETQEESDEEFVVRPHLLSRIYLLRRLF